MKYFLSATLLFFSLRIFATHIVGGEFEMIHKDNYTFEINLIMYFDDVNGNPEAEDPFVQAYIYRKSDNTLMTSLVLDNFGSTYVPYTNIECAIGELVTRRIFYSGMIYLSPETYNDPGGYYLVWQRCCRNGTITNIQNPGMTGQAFYLEFPPVIKNGRRFVNTSPRLFPPLSDYACVNHFYYVDFSGFDPDGDSLVYTLVQPLAGKSSAADPLPAPSSAPYPVVQWSQGISTMNTIPGRPPLQIDNKGLLTVVPIKTGLYVFSVLCEEYRKGEKIGEVVRDFQMLVIDCPDQGSKPVLTVKNNLTNEYSDNPPDIYFYVEDEKCLEFTAKDLDNNENLSFHVRPVNFKGSLDNFLSVNKGTLEDQNDSISFKLCFPDCPLSMNQPHILDVIAGDDACPLPLLDTVRLKVFIEPPPNHPARFDTAATHISYNIIEGEFINLHLKASDMDGDSIQFQVLAQDFDTADFHLAFSESVRDTGKLNMDLFWDSNCRKHDFTSRQDFVMYLLADDKDNCNLYDPDSIRLDIHVELPPNTPPVISTDPEINQVELHVLDQFSFLVEGKDEDGDLINMYAYADDFDLAANGFSPLNVYGKSTLTENFTWSLDCHTINLSERDHFEVNFVIDDQDKCKMKTSDTISVNFKALPPENNLPVISIGDSSGKQMEVIAGDSILLEVNGFDADNDSIELNMEGRKDLTEATGILFNPVKGKGKVSTWFYWRTDCNLLGENLTNAMYTFPFILTDDHCLVPESNRQELQVTLKNKKIDYDNVFIPNVITPNGDGYNEYFLVNDLPGDNCQNRFQYVSIYNRFGREVFSSGRRDFKWSAGNIRSGIYYYQIKYTQKEYKGYLHVLY